jgi:poly(A) polymerase
LNRFQLDIQSSLLHQLTFDESELKLIDAVTDAARTLQLETYIVGGYVRDKILGRFVKDIDFVCVGDGIMLAEMVASLLPGQPKVSVFQHFGTAHIRQADTDLEFVGARKESYASHSRKPAVEPGSLTDDQLRRDFTINALAISLQAHNYGMLIDPFNGLQDLENGVIRTPLEPDITFSDDPLRMMRAIRFASQLHFQIDEHTFQAIQQEKERIHIISHERISDELNKIILSEIPSEGFLLLFQSGLLAIIFPEFQALHGVDNQEDKHIKTTSTIRWRCWTT